MIVILHATDLHRSSSTNMLTSVPTLPVDQNWALYDRSRTPNAVGFMEIANIFGVLDYVSFSLEQKAFGRICPVFCHYHFIPWTHASIGTTLCVFTRHSHWKSIDTQQLESSLSCSSNSHARVSVFLWQHMLLSQRLWQVCFTQRALHIWQEKSLISWRSQILPNYHYENYTKSSSIEWVVIYLPFCTSYGSIHFMTRMYHAHRWKSFRSQLADYCAVGRQLFESWFWWLVLKFGF